MQTAVEWLIEQLKQLAHNPKTHLGMGDVRVTQGYIDELEEQAKEMEKQQIIDAQMDMFHHLNDIPYGMAYLTKRDSAEQFCETYGSKGSDETKTS